MFQFAETAFEPAADFAQGLGLGGLAEEHGDELIPAGEAFGVAFGVVLVNDIGEVTAIEKSEYLAEQARSLSHWNLRCRGGER